MEKQYVGNFSFEIKLPEFKNSEEAQIFSQLRIRKAMPLMEIAGVTGIYGPLLTDTIAELVKNNLATISPSGSASDKIITISGKYF